MGTHWTGARGTYITQGFSGKVEFTLTPKGREGVGHSGGAERRFSAEERPNSPFQVTPQVRVSGQPPPTSFLFKMSL